MYKNLKDRLHYLFVPSEKNNFRAKTLQHDFLTYYLAVAFLFVFLIRGFGGSISHVLGIATDITVEKLLEYTNEERKKNNLPTLSYNPKLSDAASKKAADMFAKNYWAHFSPEGDTPWDFVLDSGYSYELAGENLAKNFLYSRNVVDAWMQSPTHRENMLRSEYSDVGYAVVNGILNGEQTTLIVQIFAKPSSNAIAAAPRTTPLPAKENTLPQQAAVAAAVSGRIESTQLGFSGFSAKAASIFIFFLSVVVAIDLYVASRLDIVRLHGKSLAHFIFLVSIFAGLFFFITKGAIL